MKMLVKSKLSDYDFEIELDCPETTAEAKHKFLLKELAWRDELGLDDLYSDLTSDIPIEPQGVFGEDDTLYTVYSAQKENIMAYSDKRLAECTEFDDNGQKIQSYDINITDVLVEMLEEDENECRTFYYVQNSLMAFVDKASWHVEEDCLGFGIDKYCDYDSPWAIYLGNDMEEFYADRAQDNLSFFFEDDDWSIMEHITDFSDCTLTWYIPECGCYVPDMNEIRKQCPIELEETDTIEDISRKVAAWLQNNK